MKKALRLALWFVPAYMAVCLIEPLFEYGGKTGAAVTAMALLLYAVLGIALAMRFPAIRAATWKTALAALVWVALGLAVVYSVTAAFFGGSGSALSGLRQVFCGWESMLLYDYGEYFHLFWGLLLLLPLAPVCFYGGVLIGKELRRED